MSKNEPENHGALTPRAQSRIISPPVGHRRSSGRSGDEMQRVPETVDPPRSIGLRLSRLAALSLLVCACASPPPMKEIGRDEGVRYHGYWNDGDSHRISRDLMEDAIDREWVEDWLRVTGSKPTLVVGSVRNRASEHIDTKTFTKDLEREVVNSGRVRLVASSDERSGLRAERLDQLRNATIDTAKSMGKEIGADFILIGAINSRTDEVAERRIRTYEVELELVDLESNEKVWIGSSQHEKVLAQSDDER